MDNKITKSRLSDFLSYEWLLMLVIAIISIVVWEVFYTAGSVKLTVGQEFKYYYDVTVVAQDNAKLRSGLVEHKTFSYDIMKLSTEALSSDNYVLSDRLSIQEGDVIFTDILGLNEKDEQTEKSKVVRAKSMIDSYKYHIGSLDQMVYDAKIYLTKNFFDSDVYNEQVKELEEEQLQIPALKELLEDGEDEDKKIFNSIDDQKVKTQFLKRNKNDNRFRDEKSVNKGIELEKQRIIKLCENVLFFEDFIINNQDALFTYTRYAQTAELYDDNYKQKEDEQSEKNLKKFGREQEIFGINLGQLKGGVNASEVLQLKSPKDQTNVADGVVAMVFDFKEYQPDLQYESFSFICSTIKMFTGVMPSI